MLMRLVILVMRLSFFNAGYFGAVAFAGMRRKKREREVVTSLLIVGGGFYCC
jgi:hypothetical protein